MMPEISVKQLPNILLAEHPPSPLILIDPIHQAGNCLISGNCVSCYYLLIIHTIAKKLDTSGCTLSGSKEVLKTLKKVHTLIN